MFTAVRREGGVIREGAGGEREWGGESRLRTGVVVGQGRENLKC